MARRDAAGEFTNVAMTGRKSKGIPSRAGFFTSHQIHVTYQYVKVRAVGTVPAGVRNK